MKTHFTKTTILFFIVIFLIGLAGCGEESIESLKAKREALRQKLYELQEREKNLQGLEFSYRNRLDTLNDQIVELRKEIISLKRPFLLKVFYFLLKNLIVILILGIIAWIIWKYLEEKHFENLRKVHQWNLEKLSDENIIKCYPPFKEFLTHERSIRETLLEMPLEINIKEELEEKTAYLMDNVRKYLQVYCLKKQKNTSLYQPLLKKIESKLNSIEEQLKSLDLKLQQIYLHELEAGESAANVKDIIGFMEDIITQLKSDE